MYNYSFIAFVTRVFRSGSVRTSKDTHVEISVHCCVGGITIPEGYRRCSPAYVIRDSNREVKKNISIRLDHSLNLEKEKDCKNMAFLQGSHVSGKRHFSIFTGAQCKFEVGKKYGEITTFQEDMKSLCIASKVSGEGEKLVSRST